MAHIGLRNARRHGPRAGIVTNVEPDHLNHWGTFEAVEQGFLDFALGLRDRGGFLVVCSDDPGAARLAVAARAEGVGIGWVSILRDADLREILDIPPEIVFGFATGNISRMRSLAQGLIEAG